MTQGEFGERIRNLRKVKKLSQSKFAELCGIEPSHINNIEHGRRNVQLDTISALARGLEISESELLMPAEPVLPEQDPELNLILAEVRGLSPQGKREIAAMIRNAKKFAKAEK